VPKIKAEPTDTFPELGAQFKRLDRKMHAELDEELDELAFLAVSGLEDDAPEATGTLKRGIKTRKTKSGFDVHLSAKDPKSGFDYAAVTRFGHEVQFIRSTRGEVWDARGKPVPAKLKVNFNKFEKTSNRHGQNSNPVWLTQVRAYKPHVDWAFEALYRTEQFAERSAKSLSTRLDLRVFTGGA
jgi:hypothetical protein